jgi:hypothetical protein
MKIKLIDVDNRLSIKYDQINGIHNWGDDNAYPQLITTLVNSSVTAKQCVDLNSKYIYGKGFNFTQNITDKNSILVNKKGLNINQFLRICSKEFAKQNNLFLHINYNALFEVSSVDLISSEFARLGEMDSTGYSGKFVIYPNWDKSKSKKVDKKDFILIDRFNPNETIIEKQVEAAGGWNKYKGQILHITSDFSELYSLADLDSVLFDANSEYQAGVFKNTGLRKGFFGMKFVVTKPFEDEDEAKEFEEMMQASMGAENSTAVILIEGKEGSDILKDELFVQDIDSNIDDAKFQNTEESSARNIRKAFGVPSILIEDSDHSIFGQSGELLKEAKLTHWENKEEERNIISDAFQLIFSKFHFPINSSNDWTITPIIQIQKPTTNE